MKFCFVLLFHVIQAYYYARADLYSIAVNFLLF